MKTTIKIFMATVAIAMISSISAFAGQWQLDATGWWYQNDDNSYKKNEWFQDVDCAWYYFDAEGYIYINEWAFINGHWYYFDASGIMLSSMWIGNYYVGVHGDMLVNTTTPDGYRVGSDGAWIQSKYAAGTYTGKTRKISTNTASDDEDIDASDSESSLSASTNSDKYIKERSTTTISLNTESSEVVWAKKYGLEDYTAILATTQNVAEAINAYRVARDKHELIISDEMNAFAQTRAQEMADMADEGCDFMLWAHKRPDGSRALENMKDEVSVEGMWMMRAENAYSSYGRRDIFAIEPLYAWAHSAGHNTNQLANHTHMGIGIASDSKGYTYVYAVYAMIR